jgi:uncharacterized membrane protein YGL010W
MATVPFFAGDGTLDDELSLVHHRQRSVMHVPLHAASGLAVPVLLLSVAVGHGHGTLASATVAAFGALFLALDVPAGLLCAAWLTAARAVAERVPGALGLPDTVALGAALAVVVALLVAQAAIEGGATSSESLASRVPRFVELVATGPFYAALRVLFAMGYDPSWRERIERGSAKWKTVKGA